MRLYLIVIYARGADCSLLSVFQSLLEVLVILQTSPTATPSETSGGKEAIADVGSIYLAGNVLAFVTIVGIGLALWRKYPSATQVETRVV